MLAIAVLFAHGLYFQPAATRSSAPIEMRRFLRGIINRRTRLPADAAAGTIIQPNFFRIVKRRTGGPVLIRRNRSPAMQSLRA
jgi:hypothetical protein